MTIKSSARTRRFVSYKNALKKEKELGRTITLFDERLVKVRLKKDGTYIIEPILRLYGTDRNPDSYDNTLIGRKGYLALEITKDEEKIFSESEILKYDHASQKGFNIYEKKENYRKEYDLLDFSFVDALQIKSLPVMKLSKRENSRFYSLVEIRGYNVQELKGMQEVTKSKQSDSFYYLDVTGLLLDERLKKRVIHIAKNENDDFFIKQEKMFLLPYLDLTTKNPNFIREYMYIIKHSFSIGYKIKKDGTFDIQQYNLLTKDRLKVCGYSFGFICNFETLEELKTMTIFSDEVLNNLLEVTKKLKGYEIKKFFKSNKKLLKK